MNRNSDNYRLLIENMPDAFAYHQIITDDDGIPVDYIFLEVNAAFEEMTGLTRTEVIGKKVTQVHSTIKKSTLDWIGVYGKVAQGGEAIRFEHYFEPAKRWYEISAYSDEPGSFVAIFRDISKHKNMETNLSNMSGRLKAIIDNSPLLISEFKPDGQYLMGNKAVANLLNMETSEIAGCNFEDFLPPETVNLFNKRINSVVSNKKPIRADDKITVEDKNYYYMTTLFPLYDSSGNVSSIGSIAHDITDRVEAEEALRESEEKHRNLFETMAQGVVYQAADGAIISANPAAEKILGLSLDQMQGKTSLDPGWKSIREDGSVFPGEEHAAMVALRTGKKVGPIIMGVYHPQKQEHAWLSINATPLFMPGETKPYQVYTTFDDITERRQAEETLAGRLAFEEMVSRISAKFVNLPPEQIDEGINYTLKSVGEFFEIDRSYLYRFSEDGETYSVTHIWCRDGVDGHFEKDQDFPVELTPWWVSELKSGRIVKIADVSQMPDKLALDRADFLSEDIKSIFTLPMTLEGKVFGCFGFDTVYELRTWTDKQVALLQVVAELITGAIARHDADRQIRVLSFHDQLTGLYNRRYFEHEMERLDNSREHPIAVISADLDGLKLINDTIGHNEGDRYLQAGGEVLKSSLRSSDVLARVGGDEFALLLPRTDRAAAELLVNRIRRKIDNYNMEQQGLPLSISLGLAVSESADYALEEIYRMADNNMYTIKLQQGKKARAEIVSSLLSSLFERGNLSEGEREQVQELAIRIGQALELPEDQLARLALVAQVYDLGKVGLPDSIIHSGMQNNTGNLTDAEREALHRHPESGYRIASSSPELADITDLILKHHENYDGSGYPLGLKNDAIPVECRILSIAVAYSAMTNPRPYAEKLAHEEALAELKRCAGSQFDPDLVSAFISMVM